MKEFLGSAFITTWVAPIITGVIVVIITTIIGKVVSVWWKNRTFVRKLESANEKYINNILPYMIQEIEIDIEILESIKNAISMEYQIAEKYLYTNEQIRNQIILRISNTRFMTETHKSELINNVLKVFKNIGNGIKRREESTKIKSNKISKKYPFISLLSGLVFTLLVYFINPSKVEDPNSIAQFLLIIGIFIIFISALVLWAIILADSSVEINVEIADLGIFGTTNVVMRALFDTIGEILYGKKKKREDEKEKSDEEN